MSKLNSAMAFVKMLCRWAKSGGQLVPQETALARARVCAVCPENRRIASCGMCAGLYAMVKRATGLARRTPLDNALHVCGVCGCVNRASIWFPMDAKREALTPEMLARMPEACWQKKEEQ